jgi:hypothetical protein
LAHKDEKVVNVLLEQMSSVEERCDGYREEITHIVVEILQAERQHDFVKSNVVQKIGDFVSRVGQYYSTNMPKGASR